MKKMHLITIIAWIIDRGVSHPLNLFRIYLKCLPRLPSLILLLEPNWRKISVSVRLIPIKFSRNWTGTTMAI
jgi:hypothetical protein